MMSLKASVVAAVLAGAVTATAGITYVVTKASMNVSVSCPAPPVAASPAARPDLPLGQLPPLQQGQKF
jgi:hypothetical protein